VETVQCHVLFSFFFFGSQSAGFYQISSASMVFYLYLIVYGSRPKCCVRACVCLPCRCSSVIVGVVVFLICCQQHPIWTPNLTHGLDQKPIFLVNLWRQGRPSVVISAERKSFSYHRRGARACLLARSLLPFIKALKSYLVVL
jgi:hypothetical protein